MKRRSFFKTLASGLVVPGASAAAAPEIFIPKFKGIFGGGSMWKRRQVGIVYEDGSVRVMKSLRTFNLNGLMVHVHRPPENYWGGGIKAKSGQLCMTEQTTGFRISPHRLGEHGIINKSFPEYISQVRESIEYWKGQKDAMKCKQALENAYNTGNALIDKEEYKYFGS